MRDRAAQNGKSQAAGNNRNASTKTAPQKTPRIMDVYQPFPVSSLPGPLAAYVEQGAKALGCDPAYLALPSLAVASSAIGNSAVIRLKRGWEEPSVIWSAIVGDSGTLKSPAYIRAVAHLLRRQKECFDTCKKVTAKWKADGAEGDKPLPQRVICSDITIEKIAQVLEDNPRGILVARDELAAWFGSFTRYKGKSGGTDLPNWLELFRAGTLVIDRKTGDRTTVYVQRAAVSVAGSIQPGILARALTADAFEAGLVARLLLALPPKLPKRWSEVEISTDVENAYHETIDRLLALTMNYTGEGERVPRVLSLASDAKVVWIDFYNAWAKEQASAEGEMAAALSKLEAYAARFALVHHVVASVTRDELADIPAVARESIEAGIVLARWFAREARRVYAMLGETEDDRQTRRLVDLIRSWSGRATVKQLQRSNGARYRTTEDAEVALQSLVDDGLAKWENRTPSAKGGRPTRDCVLVSHLTTDETDETDETSEGEADPSVSAPTIPPDDTSDETPCAPENPNVLQGFVGFVDSRVDTEGKTNGTKANEEKSERVSSGENGIPGVSSGDGGYIAPGVDPSEVRSPFDEEGSR
jgi:hypothetical protein